MTSLNGTLEGLRDARRLVIPLAVLTGGAVVAWGVTNRPLVLSAGVALGLIGISLLYFRRWLPRIYLGVLWIALVGYAFADKGFAYLGYPPLYVSEVLLFLGVGVFLLSGGFRLVRRSPLTWLWMAFAAWGAVRTIPYIGTYGLDALRDAVIWGYGAFALIVAACFLRTGWLTKVPDVYRSILPWVVVWIPVILVTRKALDAIIPRYPGSGVAVIMIKPGDLLVHLAGIAAFLLTGLYAWDYSRNRSHKVAEWLVWIPWMVGFLAASMENRGGMLAVMCALAVVLFLWPASRWRKVVLLGMTLGSLSLLIDAQVDFGGEREVSVSQLAENIRSIVSEDVEEARLSATRRWRLLWWEKIRDYTLFGPYFWTGKGFGINLSASDGVYLDSATRSPHNGHLTVLARAGVPGFVLWLALQLVFGVGLVRAFLAARRQGDAFWSRMNLWILAYWVAFLVNGSFDVYLEGPQGGVWFWAVFGVGMAALVVQNRKQFVMDERVEAQPTR